MKLTRLFLVVSAVVVLVGQAAMAKDDSLDFLHLMQKEGFADIAVDYLNSIKDDPNAPPEIKRLWDLEMSKSKREKAKIAYSAAEAKQLNEEAKALMENFIKNNPDQPEAIQAAAEWATEKAILAQNEVAAALEMQDKAKKAAALASARKKFEEIRPQFVQARDSSAKIYAAVQARRPSPRILENAFLQLGDNKMNVAMIDFYLGLTLDDAAQRGAAFKTLAKELDEIYHEYCTQNFDYPVGWKAHFWNARILQEEGKYQEARDVFEEVTVHDTGDVADSSNVTASPASQRYKRKTGFEEFFADVEQQYLRVLFLISRKDYTEEFNRWRNSHKGSTDCVGYQGMAFDYARNLYEISKDPKSAAKKDAFKKESVHMLKEVAKVNGPYQALAVLLIREIDPNAASADSFDDKLFDAYAAADKKDYESAANLFLEALKAATNKVKKEKIAEVRESYVRCIHARAMELYQKKKNDDAVDLITKMLSDPDFRAAPSAAAAALFALTIKYFDLVGAPDGTPEEKAARDAIVAKVSGLAKAIVNNRDWTAKEQADSARIILVRLALAKSSDDEEAAKQAEKDGKKDDVAKLLADSKARVAEADEVFKGINIASHEYPRALTVLGFQHWHRYSTAKRDWSKKNNDAAPPAALQAQLDDDKNQAITYTQKAVENLGANHPTPMSRELRETMDLLAKMYADGNDFKKALPIYQAIVDDILKDPATKSLDLTTLQVFNGAVQAYLAENDLPKAAVIANKILELSGDDNDANLSIINFAKRLEIARKQLAAEEQTPEVAAKMQAIVDLESTIMVALSNREKFAPATMVWLARTLSLLGRDDANEAATKLVDKIIDKANNDPAFDQQVAKAKPGLLGLSAKLLAKQRKYDKAVDAIKGLIDQYPRALEPQMAKAEIYSEWAKADSSKYGEAISVWYTLSQKLERAKTAKGDRMPEYYDATYNELLCFFNYYEKTNDKQWAQKAFDLIMPMLQFDPKLQGPERDPELAYRYYRLAVRLASALGVPAPQSPNAKHAAHASSH